MTDCLIWDGPKIGTGYGQRIVDGEKWLVHRWAWTEANGSIPSGMHIHHLCGVRACYRLEHLELVTPQEHGQRHGMPRGPSAVNAAKTHCPQGHPYKQTTTQRWCPTCNRESDRKNRAGRAARVKAGTVRTKAAHGSLTRYSAGCRCGDCRAAKAAEARERRARRVAS